MKTGLLFLLACAVGPVGSVLAEGAGLTSYYDAPSQQEPRRPNISVQPSAPVSASPKRSKVYIVDDATDAVAGHGVKQQHSDPDGNPHDPFAGEDHAKLPGKMDRGIQDLEEGMDELKAYSGMMATHVQKNGLRGFMTLTPEIKAQGRTLGRKIGGGIGGVASEVGQAMVRPEN